MKNQKLFDFIYEAVLDEGGDGDATLVFQLQDRNVVADEFEQFLAKQKLQPWHRVNRENEIIIYHDFESFCLTNQMPKTEDRYSQLIVTI